MRDGAAGADGRAPLIVGIGGTTGTHSSTERALALAMAAVGARGARTLLFGGAELSRLPHYGAGAMASAEARALVAAVRDADGLLIASPGYHGSISGFIKNALDYCEETARDDRVYLDDLPVGLIVTAYGWQATGSTLIALRSIVHALRGWPTPFGAAINCSGRIFEGEACVDPAVSRQLETVGHQVADFAFGRFDRVHAAAAGAPLLETQT